MKTVLTKKRERTAREVHPMFNRIFIAALGGLCAAHLRKVTEYGETEAISAASILSSGELRDVVLAAWNEYQELTEIVKFERETPIKT
jgi:hypothetical protein